MNRLSRGVSVAVLAAAALVGGCVDAGSRDDQFGPSIVRLGDAVAAEVNGSPIYMSEVRQEALAQGLIESADPLDPNAELFTQVLEELIDQRLLALEAVRRQLHDADETRRRLATARERILGNVLVETVVDSAVTEDALRRMYEEQAALMELGDEVRARIIVVDTFEEAEEVVELLGQGRDFAELALERSKDPTTRLEGGDLGYFTPDTVFKPIADAAFSLEVGAISDPFKVDEFWHVLRVDDRRAEQRPTYEEMRPRIVRFMTFDEIQRLVEVLRTRADVTVRAGAGADADAPADAS